VDPVTNPLLFFKESSLNILSSENLSPVSELNIFKALNYLRPKYVCLDTVIKGC
jgi:hypothetical protein